MPSITTSTDVGPPGVHKFDHSLIVRQDQQIDTYETSVGSEFASAVKINGSVITVDASL